MQDDLLAKLNIDITEITFLDDLKFLHDVYVAQVLRLSANHFLGEIIHLKNTIIIDSYWDKNDFLPDVFKFFVWIEDPFNTQFRFGGQIKFSIFDPLLVLEHNWKSIVSHDFFEKRAIDKVRLKWLAFFSAAKNVTSVSDKVINCLKTRSVL